MNRLFILFFSLLSCLITSAQELKVKSFSLSNEVILSQDQRLDLNHKPCALLKIQMVDQLEKVEGNVKEFVDRGTEKWVYVVDGTNQLVIHPKNHLPIAINLKTEDYGSAVSTMESNRVYVLRLTDDQMPSGRQASDLGYGIPISYAPLSNDGRTNLQFFEDAYHQMLIGLRYFYPKTKIVCATLMRTTLKENCFWSFPDRLGGISLDDYNDAIRRAAANCHIGLADIAKRHLSFAGFAKRDRRYETLDGFHPTAEGHQTIAEEWLSCLSKII